VKSVLSPQGKKRTVCDDDAGGLEDIGKFCRGADGDCHLALNPRLSCRQNMGCSWSFQKALDLDIDVEVQSGSVSHNVHQGLWR
jgi:hypothetical protein